MSYRALLLAFAALRVLFVATGAFCVALWVVLLLAVVFWATSPSAAREDPEWENSPPHIRKWFRELMRPDNSFMTCCGEADGYEADMFEQDGDNYVAIITGQGPPSAYKPFVAPGTRIVVPKEKMKWDAGNPTGHGILFMGPGGHVFCYVTPGGV